MGLKVTHILRGITGRPMKMNSGMRPAVKVVRKKGMGIKHIAQELQIGVGTVCSVI